VREYRDFIKSNYYTAFIKWGNYCVGVNAVNPSRYLDWLLKNNIRVDTWAQDTNYDRYLGEYLRSEDALDAVYRTIEWSISYGEEQGIRPQDVLRFGNTNQLMGAVTKGKLSAWALYNSRSGHEFLDRLLPEQIGFLNDYIDPVQWNILFKRHNTRVAEVKDILERAGW
jgi:hypothetical protein